MNCCRSAVGGHAIQVVVVAVVDQTVTTAWADAIHHRPCIAQHHHHHHRRRRIPQFDLNQSPPSVRPSVRQSIPLYHLPHMSSLCSTRQCETKTLEMPFEISFHILSNLSIIFKVSIEKMCSVRQTHDNNCDDIS